MVQYLYKMLLLKLIVHTNQTADVLKREYCKRVTSKSGLEIALHFKNFVWLWWVQLFG